MRAALLFACASACAGVFASASVCAQPADVARAQQLFNEGRATMQEPGKLDLACQLLTESYKLRQRGDTLLNLAECHRRQGKTATAWREFDEAIRFAKEVEFDEAITAAQGLRDELASHLSELRITIAANPPPPGLAVSLDGEPLAASWWGLPIRLDPGVHRVTATATGCKPFEARPELGAQGDKVNVSVVLEKLPPPPEPPPPPPPPPLPEPPPAVEPPGPDVPVWAVVTGVAGLAFIGASIGLGVDAVQIGDELDTTCKEGRLHCPRDYDFSAARAHELRSFGLYVGLGVAGIGALGVGIAGLALGLSEEPASAEASDATGRLEVLPLASPEGGGLVLRVALP